MKYTTINLTPETKARLEKFKVVPGQSYEEVINFLMDGKLQQLQGAKRELGSLDVEVGILTPDTDFFYADQKHKAVFFVAGRRQKGIDCVMNEILV